MEEEEFEFLNTERVSASDFEFIQSETIRTLDDIDDFVVHEDYFNDNQKRKSSDNESSGSSNEKCSASSDYIPIVKRPKKKKKKSKVKELSTLTDLKKVKKTTSPSPQIVKDNVVPRPSYSQVLQRAAEKKDEEVVEIVADRVEDKGAGIDPFIETVLQLSEEKIDPLIETVLELSEENASIVSNIVESTIPSTIADDVQTNNDYTLPNVVTLDEFMAMNDTEPTDETTAENVKINDVTPMNDVPSMNDVMKDDVESAEVVTTLKDLVDDVTEANDVTPVNDVTEEGVSIDDITEEVVSMDDTTEEEEVVSDDDLSEELSCKDDLTDSHIVFQDDVIDDVVCDDVNTKEEEEEEEEESDEEEEEEAEIEDEEEETEDEDEEEEEDDVTEEPYDSFPLNTFDSTYWTRSLDSYGLKELFDDRLVREHAHNKLIALKTSTLMMAVTASILIGVFFGNCLASFFVVDVSHPIMEEIKSPTPINFLRRRQEKYSLKVAPAPPHFNYSIWFGESTEDNLMVVLKAYRRLQRDNTRLQSVVGELRENVRLEKQMKWYWRREARKDASPPVRYVLHDGLMKVPEPTTKVPEQPQSTCKDEAYNVTLVAKDTYDDVIGNLTKSLENERQASKYWRNRFKDLKAHAQNNEAEQGGNPHEQEGNPRLFVTSKFNMFTKAFRKHFNISSKLCRNFRNLSKPVGDHVFEHVRTAWYRWKSQWKVKGDKTSSTRMMKLRKLFQMSNVVNSLNTSRENSRKSDRYNTKFKCHPVNATNDPSLMGLICHSLPLPKALMKREKRDENKDQMDDENATLTQTSQKKSCDCNKYMNDALKWFQGRYEREIFLLKVSNWRGHYANKQAVQNGRLEMSKMKIEKEKEIEELERKILILRLKLGSYKRKMLAERKDFTEQRTKHDNLLVKLDSLLATNEKIMSEMKESKLKHHERTEELVKKIKQRERSKAKRKLDDTKTRLKTYIENEVKRIEERNRIEARNKIQKEKLKKKIGQYKSLYELSVEERTKLRFTNNELKTEKGIHKSIITNLLGKMKSLRTQVRHFEKEKKEMAEKMDAYMNAMTTAHIAGSRNVDVSEMSPHNDDERHLSLRYPEEEIYKPDCREPETTPLDSHRDTETDEYDLGGNITTPFLFGTGSLRAEVQRRGTAMRLRNTAVGLFPVFYMDNPTVYESNQPITETPVDPIPPPPPRSIHMESFFDSHDKYDNIDISVNDDEESSATVADDVDNVEEKVRHVDYPIIAQSTQGKEMSITILQPPLDLNPRPPRGIRATVANDNDEINFKPRRQRPRGIRTIKENKDGAKEEVKVKMGPERKPTPPQGRLPFRSFLHPPPFIMDANLTVDEEFDMKHHEGETTTTTTTIDSEEEDNSNQYPGPSPPREKNSRPDVDMMREIEEYEIIMVPAQGDDGKKHTGYIIKGKLKGRNSMKKKRKE